MGKFKLEKISLMGKLGLYTFSWLFHSDNYPLPPYGLKLQFLVLILSLNKFLLLPKCLLFLPYHFFRENLTLSEKYFFTISFLKRFYQIVVL